VLAHIVPPEFEVRREEYLGLLCERLLPEVARRRLARFCDVFVERGAFSLEEAQRVLGRALELWLGTKVHADQFSDGGGAALTADLAAVSAEHLEYCNPAAHQALAAAGTVAVSLPLASLYLGEPFLPAREFLGAGIPVAVATDFNPGSAPSYHLPLAMTLACLQQSMTPQEALMGATSVAARAVDAQDSIGALQPGFAADLALIDAPDLNHWLYHFRPNACQAVMKHGLWLKSPG
jgi:imidazolonepropionase